MTYKRFFAIQVSQKLANFLLFLDYVLFVKSRWRHYDLIALYKNLKDN